ncbi:MAG: hypothetical protein A2150_00840 [Candidatus Muproteobacteria bacterium RBG_16_64_11]|uniref:Uncharacterized protein n=1 Tax=Candidatus Muproteobacteria bacterium RBG_16_64_11 TaxID=1817758 RepID=A0A1F6TIP8_9PROT|nr:MAG: hypothetical protein A2150_00840 [Candidatus Muproteobacteria bacterium RBG_16_64_11]
MIDGFGVGRNGALGIGIAIALGRHQTRSVDQGDAQARDIVFFQLAGDVPVEIGLQTLVIAGRRDNGRRRGATGEQQQPRERTVKSDGRGKHIGGAGRIGQAG